MIQKPGIPKGTRDFLPFEMYRRNFIFETLKSSFVRFGFQPIETPALENISTLMGKYGDEGDKLLFKVLNSGDFLSGVDLNELKSSIEISKHIVDKGLRYDLTVPFARFVVQNQAQITFPFRRYQIQTVWRADRPQKGRYREFFQCDADVIGTRSLLCEAELVQLIDFVFNQLNINVLIKINNRKILAGIAEFIGFPEKIIDLTVAIDKIDKIGLQKVEEELIQRGISEEGVQKLRPVLSLQGKTTEKLDRLQLILNNSEVGQNGINELREVFRFIELSPLKCQIELDLSLARGLNYYTGAILEVKSLDVEIGSICGGGRYDDLTGVFGLPNVSGVGISFGADRIYDVMNQLNAFPAQQNAGTSILLVNFGGKDEEASLILLNHLRMAGINAEIYPQNDKMKKQFSYADSRKIAFVGIIGESERISGLVNLKNMETGEQESLTKEQLIERLTNTF